MQTILAAIAAGASALGLLYALISRWGGLRRPAWPGVRPAGVRSLFIFIIAWVVFFFLLTVPAFPPFSSGMTLGWGFLIGSALGIFVLFILTGASTADTVGVLAAAAFGPALILLIFHGYPNVALSGCALGAIFVAVVAASVLRPLTLVTAEETTETPATSRGVEMFALLCVAIATGALLGIDHFGKPSSAAIEKSYWAFPALMVVTSMFAAILFAHEWQGKWQHWGSLLNGLIAAAVSVLLTAVFQLHLLPELAWQLPFYGLLAFAFLLAVFTCERQTEEEAIAIRPVSLAFASVLLALTVVLVAFQRLQGYGEVLALLPALLLVALVYLGRRGVAEPVGEALGVGGVSIMLLLALYRLFLETVGHGWTLDFQQQYNLFALLLGAGACFALLAFVAQGMTRAQRALSAGKNPLRVLLLRTVLLGVLLVLTPPTLAALWGVKAVGAFLAGLVIGEAVWMLLAAWMVGEEREHVLRVVPHLFFIAAALVAIQFSHLVLGIELTRVAKVVIAGVILLALLSWILVDALCGTRKSGTKQVKP